MGVKQLVVAEVYFAFPSSSLGVDPPARCNSISLHTMRPVVVCVSLYRAYETVGIDLHAARLPFCFGHPAASLGRSTVQSTCNT